MTKKATHVQIATPSFTKILPFDPTYAFAENFAAPVEKAFAALRDWSGT